MITMNPLPELDLTQVCPEWQGVISRICETYMIPRSRLEILRQITNIPFENKLFNVTHYVHYFSEDSAASDAPTYILFHTPNKELMETVVGSINLMQINTRHVNRSNPQSYEESIVAKVMELSASIGSSALAVVGRDKAFKGTWYCPSVKSTFKEVFDRLYRRGLLKSVDSKK
jgi:hypothetical protein